LESGRFVSAYRYVFPIFFNDEHIGSIEFSISLQIIMESLSDLFGGNYQIILNSSNNNVESADERDWSSYKLEYSNSEKAGYLLKLNESKEISDINDTFALNSMINILITLMLIILILSYNNAQGRIKEIKMFDAMVVTANHEIKQPLSIISAYIEILVNDDNIDKKTKIKLRKIWANADKINYILEKLKNIEDPEYVDYANFTKMIDIENKNKGSIEG
ncbi:MAG: hypothetical protein GQ534_04770, partial [Candidatus Delongbacteria bacterium]|nr:hypothetical protein [Candidatus Delongbacteria bacterium]